jgi:[ribosomal protein S5]-alanine N-acetyltransferase
MTPRLETPRLVLRQFAASDWDAVKTILSDAETTRFMHFGTWTVEQRRQWFNGCVANAPQPPDDDDAFYWAITRRDSDEVIGWFGIGTSSDAAVQGERRFGYLLSRSCWNQGYMTEALGAVLADEFGARAAPRLSATCNVANPASARVMEKAGMRREKTVFDTDFEGEPAQQHHYAITKAEYDARS